VLWIADERADVAISTQLTLIVALLRDFAADAECS
jgi:hypothetical protein